MTFYSGLSNDLSLILNNSDDFDVTIQVGENRNTKKFRAHSLILRARCPYFKTAFSADWITKKDNMIIFSKPNITPTVFNMILKYIYAGELDLSEQSGKNILGLLVASDELLIEELELFNYAQDYLIKNQTSWVRNNFVLVLQTVFELDCCKKLQEYCLESISLDPEPFFTSETFPSLDKDILFALLKRDDLPIEESVVWDSLIKWGIEQTPSLGSDRNQWNNEDYGALKKTLNQFIPLIQFIEFSSDDFFDKVRPFKAIIHNHIYEEIEEFYHKGTLSKTTSFLPRERKLVSKIIKPKLANIITNWIDRNKSTTLPNKTYKFNLLYLMSRDGFNNVTFYNKCNGQGPFIVLIRTKSKEIYGGYNPIGYAGRSCQWLSSTESFIFSFKNDRDMRNMRIGRVVYTNCAVYDSLNYPCFINFGYGYFYIKNGNIFIGYYGMALDADILRNRAKVEAIEEIEVISVAKIKNS